MDKQIVHIDQYFSHDVIAPMSWAKALFCDVCEIVGGSQPPKKHFISEPRDGYIRLIQIRDYKSDKFITFIPVELARRFCSKDDIMIGRYGPPIFQILRGLDGAYNVALMKAVPSEDLIHKEFLYYFLKTPSLFNYVAAASLRTAGQDGVRKEHLYNYPFFIPPLNEQKRIVAKIEALNARSRKAREALDAIPELLDQFRQSVLAAAFRGDLTADWREANPDSEYWDSTKLDSLIESIKAGKNFKCPEIPVTHETVGLVKISAVTWGEFKPEETKTVDDASKIDESLFIESGDFLISRANTIELVGASVVVDSIDYKIMISDKVWRVKFNSLCDQRFVDFYLKSKQGRKEIESRATGNQLSMRNISQKSFRDIDILLPTFPEQQEIVNRIQNAFAYINKIAAEITTNLEQLNTLDQSILAKAFRGQLVPQDPNDEPASELLKRIQAAKAAATPKKKTRSKRKRKTEQLDLEL